MRTIDVVVETKKGCRYKYKFDPDTKKFRVNKRLPEGLAFPYDFGFIPGTKGEDGDPLDVMIFCEDSFELGTVVECQVIGAIKAKQSNDEETTRNDRIIAIPRILAGNEDMAIKNLSEKQIKEIEDFFTYYNKMEKKEFRPLGLLDDKETWKKIKKYKD